MDNKHSVEVRATTDPNAVRDASRLLTGSGDAILMELLQNARRSGATDIDVAIDSNGIAVTDNGHGINDPNVLLAFGTSAWTYATPGERPAGIGLFSVASHGCFIESLDQKTGIRWNGRLAAAHFRGDKPAVFRRRPVPGPSGTTIAVDIQGMKEWAVEHLVRHFPLPVKVNGRSVAQVPLLEEIEALETGDSEGILWGVYPATDDENRSLLSYHGAISTIRVPTVRNRPHLRAEVVQEGALELERPGLGTIVNNEFCQELVQFANERISAHDPKR